MRLLVAEDERDLNRIITKKLMSEGYSVDSCYDGEEAWDCLDYTDYDGVVLDIMMPRIDGMEVLRRLRKKGKDTPVLFLTAKDAISDRVAGLDSGANDYLVKPFSNARFNQALESFIARQEVFNDSASFDQKMIDDLINVAGAGASKAESKELPKGIQEITLNRVREYMKVNSARELTNEEIADDIGVSRVTARRYMTYLLEQREINGRMNYDTGGRPSMLYRYIN